MTVAGGGAVSVAELVEAARAHQAASAHRSANDAARGSEMIVVVGAHPGVGATTVAVALADALVLAGSTDVQLVDAAPCEASGTIAATDREVGGRLPGWRTAHRGAIEVFRRASAATPYAGLPETNESKTVVDAGLPFPTLMREPGPVAASLARAELVVVCRASIPGVRQAEHALRELPVRPHLAVVGARRWPRGVEASFGPLVSGAVGDGRVVLVPRDPDVEINGVDSAQLPVDLVNAASLLIELIWPGTGSATATRRRRGRPRWSLK